VVALERRGLALTMSVLRFELSQGGDGERVFAIDVRNLAGYVRDPNAIVSVVLLPFSCSLSFDTKVGCLSSAPRLAERRPRHTGGMTCEPSHIAFWVSLFFLSTLVGRAPHSAPKEGLPLGSSALAARVGPSSIACCKS
jgi:hypothetical protein